MVVERRHLEEEKLAEMRTSLPWKMVEGEEVGWTMDEEQETAEQVVEVRPEVQDGPLGRQLCDGMSYSDCCGGGCGTSEGGGSTDGGTSGSEDTSARCNDYGGGKVSCGPV